MLTKGICLRISNHSPTFSCCIFEDLHFTSTFGQTGWNCPASGERQTGHPWTNPWNFSPTWSLLELLSVCGLGTAEQERWWSRVHKTSTVLAVMAILCCSQFGQCQQLPKNWVVSLFVARQFWPELKFTEDGQELIWNRTSEQEGRSLSTACFSLVSSFYHERVWAARVRWIIWNPEAHDENPQLLISRPRDENPHGHMCCTGTI